MTAIALSPQEIWHRTSERVRQRVAMPTLWLAMQAAKPLALDGHQFVVGLSPEKQYLAVSLRTAEYSSHIEEALHNVSGQILALEVIDGESLADWMALKPKAAPQAAAAPAPPTGSPAQTPSAPVEALSWEKLSERLSHEYKHAPSIRYPHGQAQYILQSMHWISATMDASMPGPGQPRDDTQERQLARLLERFSGIVQLDPLFLSLELYRYRASQGKS